MVKIQLLTCQVKFYGYRQKDIKDVIFKIDRNSEDGVKIENQLKKAARTDGDNHSVYEIICDDGNKLYVSASDDFLSIGLGLFD